MKKITETKLQAFQIGSVAERMSKKQEEERKKKAEELAAANAFKEFVETFQGAPPPATGKVWVKAGTFDAGSRKEDTKERGKLYRPTSRYENAEKSALERTQEYAKLLSLEAAKEEEKLSLKKRGAEKKKSNLELFKEELRQIQEEREERHKYKHVVKTAMVQHDEPSAREEGSFDNGDPNTTNLYLGNLSPKISEQELMKLFGKYGPLASIKIMWPRSEEEKSRGRNCGFVAYMSRRDAERALKHLVGKDVMGYEMKLGWGKAVPVLAHPIFVPPALAEYTMPPPPSGLPFNAQPFVKQELPKMTSKDYMEEPDKRKEMDDILKNSLVKVCIPTERAVLMLIHRMIEFVIREGPMFEALIMNREMENQMFRFLFDNESPAHIYYRWKLFSLLQGDSVSEWNEKEFRMFKGGSIWRPPSMNFYTQGMPEELIAEEDLLEPNKGNLSVAQRDRLEDIIRRLTPERSKIIDGMIFCIEHADAADEICETLCEALTNLSTLPSKKIARLYLVSDILHNCTVKVQNASFFRKSMEVNLMEMFKGLNQCYKGLESRIKAEGFKVRVLQVLRAWEDWAIYSKDFLTKLKSTFLGIQIEEKSEVEDEEDLDGVPLDGAALLKSALMRGEVEDSKPSVSGGILGMDMYDDDEIDGVPLEDDDIDGVPIDDPTGPQEMSETVATSSSNAFIPSKWETVDPEEVEAGAITISKWEQLHTAPPKPPKITEDISSESESNSDSQAFDDDRRTFLRDIEMKVLEYQDELESGRRERKSGFTILEQVEHYRNKLLKKAKKTPSLKASSHGSPEASRYSSRRSTSPEDSYASSYKKSKRSRRSHSRSESPTPSKSKSSKDYDRYDLSPVRSKSSRDYDRYDSPVKSKSSKDYERSYDSSPPARRHKHRSRSRSPWNASPSRKYDSPKRYESPRRYRSPSPKAKSHKKHKKSKY